MEALARYADARRWVASALRSGRTSYGAIVRYVRAHDERAHELDIYGALLLMERVGDIREWHGNHWYAIAPYCRPYKSRLRRSHVRRV